METAAGSPEPSRLMHGRRGFTPRPLEACAHPMGAEVTHASFSDEETEAKIS